MFLKPNRAASPPQKGKGGEKPNAQTYNFPAPVRGLVTNENIARATPGGAAVLENWVPLEYSARIRGGLQNAGRVHATTACTALMTYSSGATNKLFAANATEISDLTNPVDITLVETPVVTGQTSGDYMSVNFSTAGGEFLLAVNGADRLLYYDGSTWRHIDDATTELPFDAQTVNYGAGLTVTGGTSGATGVIVTVIDNGATGTLRLKSVTGSFVDNELVTASTGSATSNIPGGVTTVPAITGVVTSTFKHITSYKSRLFFAQKDSLKIWYLPVDSIGGAAGLLTVAGVAKKGGSIAMIGTWSSDAGDGKDDVFVVITSNGEAIAYQGTDPSDASAWSLVGRYDIGAPLGKKAFLQAGGDFLVGTATGLVPMSQAVQKDEAALSIVSVARPIEPDWRSYVQTRTGDWHIEKWTAGDYAIVIIPASVSQAKDTLIVNTKTGAWAKFTGWDVSCAADFNKRLYLGTNTGYVCIGDSGGTDQGSAYYATYVGLDEDLGNPTQEKFCRMIRATFRHSTDFNPSISMSSNYNETLQTFPAAAPDVTSTPLWDVALWDVAVWDGTLTQTITANWQSVAGSGYVLAPVVQVTMSATIAPLVELISTDLLYEGGGMVV